MAGNTDKSKSGRSKTMSKDLLVLTQEFKRKISVLGTLSDSDNGDSDRESVELGSLKSEKSLRVNDASEALQATAFAQGMRRRRHSVSGSSCQVRRHVNVSPLALSMAKVSPRDAYIDGRHSQCSDVEEQVNDERIDNLPALANSSGHPASGKNRKRRKSLPNIALPHNSNTVSDERKLAAGILTSSKSVNIDKDVRRFRDGHKLQTIDERKSSKKELQFGAPSSQDAPRSNFRSTRRSSVGECNFFGVRQRPKLKEHVATGTNLPVKWFEFLRGMERKTPDEEDTSSKTSGSKTYTKSPSCPNSPSLIRRKQSPCFTKNIAGRENASDSSPCSSRSSTPKNNSTSGTAPDVETGGITAPTNLSRRRNSVCVPLALMHADNCMSPSLDPDHRSMSNADILHSKLSIRNTMHVNGKTSMERTGSDNSIYSSSKLSVRNNTKNLSALDLPVLPKIKTAAPSNCEKRMTMRTDYGSQLTKYLKSREKEIPTKTLLEIKKLREQYKMGYSHDSENSYM